MIHLLLAIIYLSFISLGLPDSLLGSAWPAMSAEIGADISYAGIISMIIAAGTIVSAVNSDRFTRKLGAGRITAISVGMTALALFGFSVSHSFLPLCLFAVPYGLGAGSVDAALNNYVALNYASRHMSWLHCMWGVGATVGPYIMGNALTGGQGWNMGYRTISLLQIALTAILLISLPIWKKPEHLDASGENVATGKALSVKEVVGIKGMKEMMLTFFCFCALEQTTGLWGSSYLVLVNGVTPEDAAHFAGLFFLGVTLGRAISGFVTMAMSDKNMIRLGIAIVIAGLSAFIPQTSELTKAGLIIIGLGCAPIFPCVIHSTPENFGADKSQAAIGILMASAYAGTLVMPPIFGLIAQHTNIALLPLYLLFITAVMALMHERVMRRLKNKNS